MKCLPFRDIDRSAGISCAATVAPGDPAHNPPVTHHERPPLRPVLRRQIGFTD